MSAVMTWAGDMAWGWDFAARCLIISAVWAVMGPLIARSRQHAEQRDAQHMHTIREARRGQR